jgi:MtN3 and saliva related transmembrane protein
MTRGASPYEAKDMQVEILVSAAAATLTTAAFVPQALHIIRHKETRAISMFMYISFAVGVALWLLFGTMIGNWPIIVSNGITLLLAVAIIAMKLKYG